MLIKGTLYAWITSSPAPADNDNLMIVLQIHGLCMGSQLIPGMLEPGYVVLLGNGASI